MVFLNRDIQYSRRRVRYMMLMCVSPGRPSDVMVAAVSARIASTPKEYHDPLLQTYLLFFFCDFQYLVFCALFQFFHVFISFFYICFFLVFVCLPFLCLLSYVPSSVPSSVSLFSLLSLAVSTSCVSPVCHFQFLHLFVLFFYFFFILFKIVLKLFYFLFCVPFCYFISFLPFLFFLPYPNPVFLVFSCLLCPFCTFLKIASLSFIFIQI